MKKSMFGRLSSRFGFARAGFGPLIAIAAACALAGCNQGAEGDRCNPDLSHDECNAGLTCQQPAACPENYCCPVNGGSDDPNCQAGCTVGGVAGLCATDPTAAACVDAGATTDAADAGEDAAKTTDSGVVDAGKTTDSGGVDAAKATDSGGADGATKDAATDASKPTDGASHG